MPALFAFLHHAAAFALVAALAAQFMLIRQDLTVRVARTLARVDIAYGVASGLVLLVGACRVAFFEKGWMFYLTNAAFLAKLAAFMAVGLLSVYPTVIFVTWRSALKEGRVPEVSPGRLARLRMVIHLELAGIALILAFAAMMARGIGSLHA